MQLLPKNLNKKHISSPHAFQSQATLKIPTKANATVQNTWGFGYIPALWSYAKKMTIQQCCQDQNIAKGDTINHLH